MEPKEYERMWQKKKPYIIYKIKQKHTKHTTIYTIIKHGNKRI
jgi:hypothetical protein